VRLFFKVIFKEIYHLLKNKNQREFLKLVFYYGDKPRYTMEKISCSGYVLNVPDCLSFVWQYKEIFADENYKFISDNPAPIIYDCGSNIGMSCLYFKKIFPAAKITAFEADPKIADILAQNLEQNKLVDITVIPKAVWINNDGVEISSEGADASSIYLNNNKIKIESIRLKDLVNREKKIDLIKMDIEGAETDVLRDCKEELYKINNIFVEFHSFINNKQSLDEILDIFEVSGFRYFIKPAADRIQPFLNRTNKNFPEMDLQLNIYAYKN
jgi:FkbM family methyltransferase